MKTGIRITFLILLFINAVCHAAQVKTLIIYFEKDKAYFTNGEATKLKELKSADYVLLKGHTDNDGSDDYNIALSKKRVDAVKAFVRGLDAGIKVEANYYGERVPVNNNAGEKEKTLNRRVEVTYVIDPLMRVTVPQQQYEIDNTSNQVITCMHGTQVNIPAGAFNNGCVQINISEYYSATEIFAANLTTTSDKAPIETAGMINITAEVDGQSMQPSAPLQYKFPRKNKAEDFSFFSGVRDTVLGMNWELKKTEKPKITTKEPKEGYTQLKGWDSCEVLSTGIFSAYLKGPGMDSFWMHVRLADKGLVDGCMANGKADLMLNKEGKIVSLKTNYQGKNNAWDNALKKFIRSYFPDKIETAGCDASVHIEFGRLNTILTGTLLAGVMDGNGWMANFGKEYVADYETDKIILSSSNMGWINCDRFMHNCKLTTFKVNTDEDANVRLMMKNYNSFFANEFSESDAKRHQQNKGEYGFYRIPDNEEVVVICTKKVNGVLYLAIEPTKISSGSFTISDYKPVTQEELEAAIKELTI